MNYLINYFLKLQDECALEIENNKGKVKKETYSKLISVLDLLEDKDIDYLTNQCLINRIEYTERLGQYVK